MQSCAEMLKVNSILQLNGQLRMQIGNSITAIPQLPIISI